MPLFSMVAECLQTDTPSQREQALRQAAEALARGQLVIFPTETVYGVAAWAAHEQAWRALCRLTGQHSSSRPPTPLTVHVPDRQTVGLYLDLSQPPLARLVRKLLPGPVTLLVELSQRDIQRIARNLQISSRLASRLFPNRTLSLRCPDCPLAAQLLALAPVPVVATAVPSRGLPVTDAQTAAHLLADQVAVILDGGTTRYAKPSTVLRLRRVSSTARRRGFQITFERPGVFDERFIRKLLRCNILFVCTGNTCRSPLAQVIARQILAQHYGVKEHELEQAGVSISSAGVAALAGCPASSTALEVARQMGLDLSTHRSRPLSPELIRQADLIYCMSRFHRQAVLDMVPEAADRTFLLDDQADLDDPVGGDLAEYQACAQRIRAALEKRFREHQP